MADNSICVVFNCPRRSVTKSVLTYCRTRNWTCNYECPLMQENIHEVKRVNFERAFDESLGMT
ncbi:hypothetical protein X975_00143, partial [Stegodyphus mimosarum]